MTGVVLWAVGAVVAWFVATYMYGLWVASKPPENREVGP